MARGYYDKSKLTEGEVLSTLSFLTGGKVDPSEIERWGVVIITKENVGIMSDECPTCAARLLITALNSLMPGCVADAIDDDNDTD